MVTTTAFSELTEGRDSISDNISVQVARVSQVPDPVYEIQVKATDGKFATTLRPLVS
jgi:hypothetical protein